MADISHSQPDGSRGIRFVVWGSALVLLTGVIAYATVQLTGDDTAVRSSQQPLPDELNVDKKQPANGVVPTAARKVAGEFILVAAGREDLAKAWKITHPDLKAQCACTYEEWLTGNIPIQYFPTKGLVGAAFAVTEVTADEVILTVQLTPAKDSGVESTAFYIGMKNVGTGGSEEWLVDYWAPYVGLPVPRAE